MGTSLSVSPSNPKSRIYRNFRRMENVGAFEENVEQRILAAEDVGVDQGLEPFLVEVFILAQFAMAILGLTITLDFFTLYAINQKPLFFSRL